MCSTAWRANYKDLFADNYIDRVVAEYYNLERITREVSGPPTKAWGGYIVAKNGDTVVGAIGGAVEAAAGQVWMGALPRAQPSPRGDRHTVTRGIDRTAARLRRNRTVGQR